MDNCEKLTTDSAAGSSVPGQQDQPHRPGQPGHQGQTVDPADTAGTADTADTAATAAAEPQTPTVALSDAQIRTVISLLAISAFVVILNETILSVALPRIMADLHISAATAQWLTTAFMLTMSVVIPTTGFILERFSTRRVFVAALGLFLAGTIIAAAAPGFAILLAARIIQACGTALVLPLLMTTVLEFVPVARRGAVMGVISVVIAVAPAIGPTISGVILSFASWRWLFLFMIPIVIIDLAAGTTMIVSNAKNTDSRLDIASVPLAALGFGTLVYGLSAFSHASGGLPVEGIVCLLVGAGALFLFSRRQVRLARTSSPLLNLSPFTLRQFCLAVGGIGATMGAMMGVVLVLPIYLQDVHGASTLTTGMAMLPGGLLMGLFGPVIGRIFDKFGARPLVAPGALLAFAALVGFVFVGPHTPLWLIVILHSAMSLGMSFVFTPLMTVGLGDLSPALYSHGSAIVNTMQQLSGAVGTAVLIAVLSVVSAHASDAGALALNTGTSAAFGAAAALMLVVTAMAMFIKNSDGRSQLEAVA